MDDGGTKISPEEILERWERMVTAFQTSEIPLDVVSYLALMHGLERLGPRQGSALTLPRRIFLPRRRH